MRVLTLLSVLLTASILSPLSSAYPIDSSIGIGSGITWTEAVFNDPVLQLNAETETPSYSDVSNSGLPFNLYGNLRFHSHYGIELGYIDYGTIEFDKSLIKTSDADNEVIESRLREASINTSGFYLNHVAYIPVTDRFLVLLKAGLLIGSSQYSDIETLTVEPKDAEVTQQISTSITSNTESLVKVQLAGAITYRSTSKTAWRLQLSQIEVSHDGEKENFTQWFSQISYEIKL